MDSRAAVLSSPSQGSRCSLPASVGGYLSGVPHTVRERVSMWLSPWDNLVHGGDQLAHSLWAYATGGIAGTGMGQGDPGFVPAGHTDLILAVLGEQWGFLGVAAVFALYGLLLDRTLRIARGARSDYEFFLAAGIAAATAFQILLIAGGSLGVLPLSGVVTPFLSYGRTAMLANFAMFGIALSVKPAAGNAPAAAGGLQTRAIGFVFAAAAAIVVAKAGYIQVLRADATVGAGTLVIQADGARRYQYNPRLIEIMRDIPKGTIFDRNGLPLATSDWTQLEKHRADYRALGIDIDVACPRAETRHYPFGGLMFDLLGDLRTRTRWGATNTSFVERDSARRLRGYDDRPTLVEVRNPKTGNMDRVLRYVYRELLPLLRHRRDPQNPAVRRVLDRPRDVRMSIDSRLEVRVAEILRAQLKQSGQTKGAAVVMDPATGDLLAAVSFPLPVTGGTQDEANPYLDRARYGLYPPGSTFKVVTAMAALRKDALLAHKNYQCIRLPDGRTSNFLEGSKRPIRDDVEDKNPHGTLDLERGLVVSCNAYFAQLGAYDVGAEALHDTATLLGIAASSPDTAAELKKALAQSSYGQGEVVASPFQMARVAATVANGGGMPQGRWLADENNLRTSPPTAILPVDTAATLGRFMREVVTGGTGRRAGAAAVPIAGKTGTAELADAPSHAWFIGFAPYGGAERKIAFSVLVENGVYGGTAAAPAAAGNCECGRETGADTTVSVAAGSPHRGTPMSIFSEIEKTIERGFQRWTERMFGPADSNDLMLLHRAVMEDLAGQVQTLARGRRIFPFARVIVTLIAPDPARRTLLQAAFGDRLGEDVRSALEGSGCQLPRGFSIEVQTAESGVGPYAIDYAAVKSEASDGSAVPGRLVVLIGKTQSPEYTLQSVRTNLGRMPELLDADQRVVRRNHVVFEEAADEANATVSRQHAHIRAEGVEYRLFDDASEFGTRVFRDGRSIEVPAGDRRGEKLRAGDEIYLGRACLRFERL